MSNYRIDDYPLVLDKIKFSFSMLVDPLIMLALILTLGSGLSWMIAMIKFEVSYAYPFTALGLLFVVFFSVVLGESINIYKVIGVFFVVIGIVVLAKGQ